MSAVEELAQVGRALALMRVKLGEGYPVDEVAFAAAEDRFAALKIIVDGPVIF